MNKITVSLALSALAMSVYVLYTSFVTIPSMLAQAHEPGPICYKVDKDAWYYLGMDASGKPMESTKDFAQRLGEQYKNKQCPDGDVEVMILKSGAAHIYGRCVHTSG
jgi:hypothetical protein